MTQHLVPEQGCITLQSLAEPREPVAHTGPCLNDDELALFAEGNLPEETLVRLESHLDVCSTCQHLINAVARALDTVRESSALGGYSSLFAPGTLVANRYRIERFLARGGMGEVYEAFDQELSERVALKTVISTACDSPRAERKLKGEVQLARRISHPNVCRIYDLGVHEPSGARPRVGFLTMEFIDGESLGRRLKSGPLAAEQADAVARQLLAGLAAAHEAGVLHRDFKSDNVMLRRDATPAQEVVITDFGLARALDPRGPGVSDSAHIVGSPAYMAPEQVMGHELGRETDVFAFGVVFFEMLTGKLPFAGESAIVAAVDRLNRAPEAPSSAREGLTRRYDEFVLKCLQRERKRRFADAKSALLALEALPPSGRLVTRRSRKRAGAVPALLLALVGGAALYAERTHGVARAELRAPSAATRAASVGPRATPSPTTVSARPLRADVALDTLIALPSSTEPALAARPSERDVASAAAPRLAAPIETPEAKPRKRHGAPAPAASASVTQAATPPADAPDPTAGSPAAPSSPVLLPAPSAPIASAPAVKTFRPLFDAPSANPAQHPPPRAARDRLLNPFEASE
jgi:hypothetical protein